MGGGGEAGQSRAVPGRLRSASSLSFCWGGMVMEGRLWTQVPPACFSAPCTRSHLPLLPSCFVLRGAESDLAAGAHLRFCSLAFLLCSFRNQEKHTSPISFSYFEEVKKGGEREGERERERASARAQTCAKIGRKPCKKMSLTDLFSFGFLSSCFLNLSEKLRPCPHDE